MHYGIALKILLGQRHTSTSSPGPSPPSKWRSEKPLAKVAEILHESWSILSRDTMKWLFRRLFPASGSPVCFLQSETVIQTKQRHVIVFAWPNSNELLKPLLQSWPGVSPTAILNEEKALGTRLRHTSDSFKNIMSKYHLFISKL